MIDPRHVAVLRLIHSRLAGRAVDWVLTGSLGLALQGVRTEVHDIDLQTDRDGAYEIEHCFAEARVRPVRFLQAKHIRSHFGSLEIDGIQVEIMGDLQKRLEDGSWETPVDVAQQRHWIAVDRLVVPVLSLAHEYEAYRRMKRFEKADLIRQAMNDY